MQPYEDFSNIMQKSLRGNLVLGANFFAGFMAGGGILSRETFVLGSFLIGGKWFGVFCLELLAGDFWPDTGGGVTMSETVVGEGELVDVLYNKSYGKLGVSVQCMTQRKD